KALETTSLSYRYIENSVIIFPKQSNERLTDRIEAHDGDSFLGIIDQNRDRAKTTEKVINALASFKPIELYNKRLVLNISGQVTNVNGEPLIGVNILVKRTNKGTTTDMEGQFSLNDVDDQAVLEMSYIGYQDQDVAVNGQTYLSI